MSRFAHLAAYLLKFRASREFKSPDGHFYQREWSLTAPMSYDEWLYWHLDPPEGPVNPLAEDDDFYEDDDESYVEERGPPRPMATTDDEELAAREARNEANAAALHERRMKKLGELDRKIRDLAALRGIYMLPTPKEKA